MTIAKSTDTGAAMTEVPEQPNPTSRLAGCATHPFVRGRFVRSLPIISVVSYLGAYQLWYASLGTNRCGIPIPELAAQALVLAGAWILVPRMATWEATPRVAIRRLTTACMLAVVAVAAATPIVIHSAVTSAPAAMIPQHETYSFDGMGPSVWLASVTNVVVIGSVVMTSVAVLGRFVGALVALSCGAGMAWLAVGSTAFTPYRAFCSGDVPSPAWWPATVALAITTAVWSRTAGSSSLARYLDHRQ